MDKEIEALRDRVAALDGVVTRNQAILDIHDVLARYSRALDWIDAEMLESVFFDDAEIEYGLFRGNGRDFKAFLIEFEKTVARRWHFTSQLKIQLDGDSAEVESYNFTVSSDRVAPGEGSGIMHFYGFYLDRLVRREGRWGIIYRKHLQVSGAALQEISAEGPFALLNQIGMADTSHPDYRKLG